MNLLIQLETVAVANLGHLVSRCYAVTNIVIIFLIIVVIVTVIIPSSAVIIISSICNSENMILFC